MSCRSCRSLPLPLAPLLAAGLACGCAGPTQAKPGSDGNVTEGADAGDDGGLPRIELTDKMNYVFHSSLSAVTTPVRANGDITFDWSNATVDMLGRRLDPLADVDMMQLMLWRYGKDAFLAAINQEELQLGRLIGMGYCDTQRVRTDCRLFDLLSPAGSPIAQDKLLEYVDAKAYSPEAHVWVVMLATGRAFGQGTRLMAFVQPTDGETNDAVHLSNDSTTLSYTADLATLEPVPLPQHTGDVVLSWADDTRLTRNGMGADWVPTYITDVAVGRYVGYSIADLQRQFLLLQDLASEQYAAHLNVGQEVSLARLTDRAGNPFPGIDENGIWLLSLTCGSCRNPAPWFLSILQVRN
jgi:hypothetical protein